MLAMDRRGCLSGISNAETGQWSQSRPHGGCLGMGGQRLSLGTPASQVTSPGDQGPSRHSLCWGPRHRRREASRSHRE